jgi:hypothetical protein
MMARRLGVLRPDFQGGDIDRTSIHVAADHEPAAAAGS